MTNAESGATEEGTLKFVGGDVLGCLQSGTVLERVARHPGTPE